MNDPHVKELHYKLVHSDTVDYARAPPLEHDKPAAFSVHVANGRAVFEMKGHYVTQEAAKQVVDPYLRAWEIAA